MAQDLLRKMPGIHEGNFRHDILQFLMAIEINFSSQECDGQC